MQLQRVETIGLARARDLLTIPTGVTDPLVEQTVREILSDVQRRGEQALLDHTHRLDSPVVTSENLRVPEEEIDRAVDQVSAEFLRSIEIAAGNIRSFHESQRSASWMDYSRPGIVRGQILRPLDRVGVLAPGASAPLASTVLMTAVPARVAGVPEVYVCTPPRRNGSIDPHVLAAARIAGATAVFRCFGAQAVGALAFGAGQVPRVDKIVGPGNAYVVTAKRLVYGYVDIESLPGPSEILLLSDGSGVPAFAAADLISQAEHPEGRAVLLTPDERFAEAVLDEITRQSRDLPEDSFVPRSLQSHGLALITENLDQAFELANLFAPEHLVLLVEEPALALSRVHNAGTLLFGDYTSKAIDDYAAGPSHVLPTGGTARFSSGLGLHDFVRRMNVVSYSRDAALDLAPVVETLAEAEGLPAHRRASAIRREGLQT